MNSPTDNPSRLDKLGIWISSLCAVHCLAVPVLVPLLPLFASSFFAQAWFEHTILTISMLIGCVALINGASRYHGRYYPVVLLVSGGTIYWFKDILGHGFEPLTITVGALLIIASHWINIRLMRKHEGCENPLFCSQANSH